MKKIVILLVFGALVTLLPTPLFAYEFTFDGGIGREYPSFYFTPLNYRFYAVDIMGTRCGILLEQKVQNYYESKDHRFKGTYSNEVAVIEMQDSRATSIGVFRKGRLTNFKRADVHQLWALDRKSLSTHAPRKVLQKILKKRDVLVNSGKLWWKDTDRWRLWFDNPNEAGALFAVVFALFLGLFMVMCQRLRYVLLMGSLTCLFGIVKTGSRGSLVAALLAAILMAVIRYKGDIIKCKKLVFVIIAISTLSLAGLLLLGSIRMPKMNKSTHYRLEGWISGPRLMVLAPTGWWRSTGYCYCDWLQDTKDDYMLRWLVNSHLSVMAHVGWALSFAYILVWVSLLGLMIRQAWRTGKVAVLGVWTTLLVSMWFSTIGVSPSFWVVPVLTLIPILGTCFRKTEIKFKALAYHLPISAVILAAFLTVGYFLEKHSTNPFLVRREMGKVSVGAGDREIHVVEDGFALTGGYPGPLGKEIRDFVILDANHRRVIVSDNVKDLPRQMECLVLAGERCAEYFRCYKADANCPRAKKLMLVSPSCAPSELPKELMKKCEVSWVTGEFAAEILDGYEQTPAWVEKVPGCMLYIPDWLKRVGL